MPGVRLYRSGQALRLFDRPTFSHCTDHLSYRSGTGTLFRRRVSLGRLSSRGQYELGAGRRALLRHLLPDTVPMDQFRSGTSRFRPHAGNDLCRRLSGQLSVWVDRSPATGYSVRRPGDLSRRAGQSGSDQRRQLPLAGARDHRPVIARTASEPDSYRFFFRDGRRYRGLSGRRYGAGIRSSLAPGRCRRRHGLLPRRPPATPRHLPS